MARAQGVRAQMALAFESAYGTAPASGYKQMSFASQSLGAEQPLLEDDRLGQGRDPLAPVLDAVTVSGDVTAPLEIQSIGAWLKGAFGAPTTTEATGVYTHVFQSGSFDLPSMAVEIGLPEIPRFAMYSGLKVDTFGLQMQRSGMVNATLGLIGRAEAVATTTAAGTPTAYTEGRVGAFNATISRNGTALGNVVSASVNYANGLDPVEVIAANGLIAGVDASRASLTGQLVTRFDSTTLVDQAIAGEACTLTFAYALPSGESFTIVAHAAYLSRPRVPIGGPQGVQVTFDWQAAKATDPARMCTVTLVNDVASY